MHRFFLLASLLCGTLCAQTVLVLPFANHSNSPNLSWVGESISESLGDSLASEGLLVLDRSDRLEAYRRLSLRDGAEVTHASIIKIGQSLDASFVVYGFFELLGPDAAKDVTKGSLQIQARIMDLKQMRQNPEFGQSGILEDLTAIEHRLSWQALSQLRPKGLPTQAEFVSARPVVRIDAVESYIRGLMATTPEQRHRFFTQAARLDEKYSQPRFQLGVTYWEKKDYKVAAGWFEGVDRTNSHYLEAQFFLGLCRYEVSDFEGAERAFQLVAATMPLNEVFNNLGAAQSRQGKTAEAIANFSKAIDGDSGDPEYHFNLGYVYWRSGKFAQAVESFRQVLARNASDTEATVLLGRALKQDGPRPADIRLEARERIKTNYDAAAYRQLQAELAK